MLGTWQGYTPRSGVLREDKTGLHSPFSLTAGLPPQPCWPSTNAVIADVPRRPRSHRGRAAPAAGPGRRELWALVPVSLRPAPGEARVEAKFSRVTDDLRNQLMSLPEAERAELAHLLIQSLETDTDPDREELWDRELDRRAREINEGGVIGIPLESVFKELHERHQ